MIQVSGSQGLFDSFYEEYLVTTSVNGEPRSAEFAIRQLRVGHLQCPLPKKVSLGLQILILNAFELKFKRTVNENHVNGERSVFIFEFKDLEVIEISCTFANRNMLTEGLSPCEWRKEENE